MSFKLPQWLRPYASPIISTVVTVGAAAIGTKVPFIKQFINVETVSATVVTWLFATSVKTGSNALGINKSNSSTGRLSANVPAVVVPNDVKPLVVDHPAEVINPTGGI